MEPSKMDDFFASLGIGFPENEEQLKMFNLLHEDYSFQSDESEINPASILETIDLENKPITHIDYHKRTVLAAEIVFQLHQENTMGHLKLQKLMYLCQHTTGMSLHTNFLRQALGPYDPKLMRSIDKQFKNRKWFEFTKGRFPPYKPLEKAGEHRVWFERYFKDQVVDINFLIQTFKKAKSDKVELVATIYACWLKMNKNKQLFSENLMIKKVYAWSKGKIKFSEQRIRKAIRWMNDIGLKPS